MTLALFNADLLGFGTFDPGFGGAFHGVAAAASSIDPERLVDLGGAPIGSETTQSRPDRKRRGGPGKSPLYAVASINLPGAISCETGPIRMV